MSTLVGTSICSLRIISLQALSAGQFVALTLSHGGNSGEAGAKRFYCAVNDWLGISGRTVVHGRSN